MNLIEYEITKNRELDDFSKETWMYARTLYKAISLVLTGVAVILMIMTPTLRGTIQTLSIILAFLMIVDFSLTMFIPRYLDTKAYMLVARKMKLKTMEMISEARLKEIELVLPVPDKKLSNYNQSIYSEIMSISQYIKNNNIRAELKDIALISVISVTQKTLAKLVKPYAITERQKEIIKKLEKYYRIDIEKYCDVKDSVSGEYELRLDFKK